MFIPTSTSEQMPLLRVDFNKVDVMMGTSVCALPSPYTDYSLSPRDDMKETRMLLMLPLPQYVVKLL